MKSSPSKSREYKLEIAFEKKKTGSLDKFKTMVSNLLKEHSKDVDINIKAGRSNCFILSLSGPLEKVDKCHEKIEESLIKKLKYNFIRLIDGPGNEIRKRAYPILARIEQQLRLFIDNAMIEVSGFDWWQKIAHPELKIKIEKISKHDKSLETSRHLELTQFDELIKLITAESSVWQNDKLLTAREFSELLNECNSIEEVKKKIDEKVTPFSLWDNVFSRYFDNKEHWRKTNESIDIIVRQRHKVMHHRPIHFNELKLLRAEERKIRRLIEKHTNIKLSEEERIQTKEILKSVLGISLKYQQAIASFKATIAKSLLPSQGIAQLLISPKLETLIPRIQIPTSYLKYLQTYQEGED